MSAWFNRVVLSQSGGGRLKHGNVEQRTTDDLTLNKGSIKRRYILKKRFFSRTAAEKPQTLYTELLRGRRRV